MFSWRAHPDGEHLLRFCEGELAFRENSRIARHVEGCWECRAAIDDLRGLINEYVRYRSEVLRASLPPPPTPWIDLSSHLRARKIAATTRRSGRFFRGPAAWLLFGGATLVAATTLFWKRLDFSAEKYPSKVVETRGARASHSASPPATPNLASAHPENAVQTKTQTSSSPAVTAEDELNVVAALHRIGADLGDPIDVVRSSGEISVTGAGLNSDRVQQVQSALSGMPHVSLHFADPPKPAEEESHPLDVQPGRSPLESNLGQRFPNSASYERFVDETLRASEEMMARAHALRRLADRFPPSVEVRMKASALDLLTSMRHDLAANLVEDAANIDRTLTPVLRSLGETIPTRQPPPISDWESLTSTLFTSADRTDTLIGALLATTANSKSESTSARLAGALGQLKADTAAYRQFVSRRRDEK